MKAVLPWFMVLVFGAATSFFFQNGQKKTSELAITQAELAKLDQLREENAELEKLSSQVTELDKLRRDHAELIRLRGEVDGAKQQWALEKHMSAQNVPQPQDIAPYLGPGNALPQCPAGGTYTLNNVSTPPTCSIAGHALPPRQ